MIQRILKKIKLNKQPGFSEFISSIFSILAIATIALIMIQFIGDISTRIQMDQVARKYMLRIESSGTLTFDEAENIKSEMTSISNVTECTTVTLNGNAPSDTSVGYGNTAKLTITCKVNRASFVTSGTFGNWKREPISVTITKQSTAKY